MQERPLIRLLGVVEQLLEWDIGSAEIAVKSKSEGNRCGESL